jgi:hypothetical protein
MDFMVKEPLNKDSTTKDACHHDRTELAPDGERVCKDCGVVVGEHELPAMTTPKINLFVSKKLGSNPLKHLPDLSNPDTSLAIVNRHKDNNDTDRYLSNFSNVCSKLRLSSTAAEHAWRLFVALQKDLANVSSIYLSEKVSYAIASGAAIDGRLIDERTLSETVTFVFGSKVIRDMYYIRRAVETRVDVPLEVRPQLTLSARWTRGRYGP